MHFLSISSALIALCGTALANHFYSIDPNSAEAASYGFHVEGTCAWLPPSDGSVTGVVPVYQWINSGSVAYFYTTDPNGELAPQYGYTGEGVAFYVYDVNQPQPANTVPFYRWLTDYDHFYSTSLDEGNNNGFTLEGTLGYVYNSPSVAVTGYVDLIRYSNT